MSTSRPGWIVIGRSYSFSSAFELQSRLPLHSRSLNSFSTSRQKILVVNLHQRLTRFTCQTPLRHVHQNSTPTTGPQRPSISHQSQPNPTSTVPFATLLSSPNRSASKHSPSIKPFGIKITPAVIEQIERVRKLDNKPNEVLRVSVESGGCHGFQYKMEFNDGIEEDDFVFTVGDRNGMVVVDKGSLELMDGSTIDFAVELIGSSFRVSDNPRSAGKGCGCGVSWELK